MWINTKGKPEPFPCYTVDVLWQAQLPLDLLLDHDSLLSLTFCTLLGCFEWILGDVI